GAGLDDLEHDLALWGDAVAGGPEGRKGFGVRGHGVSPLRWLLLQFILTSNYSGRRVPRTCRMSLGCGLNVISWKPEFGGDDSDFAEGWKKAQGVRVAERRGGSAVDVTHATRPHSFVIFC